MGRLRLLAAAALVAVNVTGCTSANQGVANASLGETKALVTTGNIRLVTERRREGFPPVVCTEPSPDYAVAFGSSGSASGTFTPGSTATATGPGGQGQVSIATTEQVSTGRGRAAAVLALRDGLYAACQSYANGVIGHDAYAIILSQYGRLLVALVGGGVAEEGRTNAVAVVAIDAKQATLSALVVACISHHDQTRDPPLTRSDLLTPTFCRNVLARAARI